MRLLNEMQSTGFLVITKTPNVQCTLFENNAGAIQIAKIDKTHPSTKHMATKLHHFATTLTNG